MQLFKRKLSAKQKEALSRLADGIECGAALRPQGFQSLFPTIIIDGSEFRGSCALGAAWECHLLKQNKPIDFQVDVGLGKIDYADILAAYGVKNRQADKLVTVEGQEEPLTKISSKNTPADLVEMIWRMNDLWKWSRERIAQFLREAE